VVEPILKRQAIAPTSLPAMVEVANPYPIWWRGIPTPPPAAWVYTFEEFTGADSADEWALAAAIFIAQVRRRTSHGPTFKELFTQLLPDTNGLPGPFPDRMELPDRQRAISGFRIFTAIEWRHRGMIGWEIHIARSLRVGREFPKKAREHQQLGSSDDS
jgi:hypothetical protein